VNLESTIERLARHGIAVILGGVNPQPAALLARAGWESEEGRLVICERFDDAVALARLLAPPPREPRGEAPPGGDHDARVVPGLSREGAARSRSGRESRRG
jgi:hypothetical protein